MSIENEEFSVIGFNDLDTEGKKVLAKKQTDTFLKKTYYYMDQISTKVATQLGLNDSYYQYAQDAIDLRRFHDYIKLSRASENNIVSIH
jgi:hypothetical protein